MGNYLEKIASLDNLEAAWRKVKAKNAAGGLDGVNPGDMSDNDVQRMLKSLQNELESNAYIPIPFGHTSIPKFNEAEEWRNLSLPALRDKVVQHAFIAIVGPVFEKKFLDTSYAYRPGRGSVEAIQGLETILREEEVSWAIPLDIDDFFDSMDHDILLKSFAWELEEKELLSLIRSWLEAGVISKKGDWMEPDEGIAQGSVVSPLLSNIYLHSLDEYANKNSYHYIRYSDNFILLSKEKDQAYSILEDIKGYLSNHLKLKLNENPYPFKNVHKGFVFLGVYFQGKTRRISRVKEGKIIRKIEWLTNTRTNFEPESYIKQLNQSIEGTKRHYGFINPEEQFKTIDDHLLKRLHYLLAHFYRRRIMTTQEELKNFVGGIKFYARETEQHRYKTCDDLIKGVMESIQAEQGGQTEGSVDKDGTSSRAKRQTSQKSKYLRRVMDQSEVILSTPGLFLGKTGGRVIIKEQRRVIAECPFAKVRNVSINTKGITMSSDLIFECSKTKIPIALFNPFGQPYATLQSPVHSMGATSVLQIRAYETKTALKLSQKILTGKTKNQMNLLKFYLRSRKKDKKIFTDKVKSNIQAMESKLQKIQAIQYENIYSVIRDKLFTNEAHVSQLYWDCVKMLLPVQLGFTRRDRAGAQDLVNNMLNYGYGILYQRVWSSILKVGLNPHISFLHAFQQNKPTFVYDLVEEFRQPFVDRAVISLLTKGKKGADFNIDKQTGYLDKHTKNQVVKAVLGRLSSLVSFRQTKVKGEDIIEIQAKNVVDFLQGKRSYKPFIAGY